MIHRKAFDERFIDVVLNPLQIDKLVVYPLQIDRKIDWSKEYAGAYEYLEDSVGEK